jgi:hypothetical protein
MNLDPNKTLKIIQDNHVTGYLKTKRAFSYELGVTKICTFSSTLCLFKKNKRTDALPKTWIFQNLHFS